MSRVAHFELVADDPHRAVRFYTDVFGWQFHRWEGPGDYWLISTGETGQPEINGGLCRRTQPNEFTITTIDVEDLDEAVRKVVEHGGMLAAPKITIAGVGYLAYCRDTEGNTFGIRQSDPTA